MNMGTAIMTCFKKYATYSGRASRSEFWYFLLFYLIVEYLAYHFGIIGLLVEIVVWIPLFAAGIRRLHDADKSGWWILCPILNLIFFCAPSVIETERGL
jgi:uncharacterized membrane protein YhaH (DUF805 family)